MYDVKVRDEFRCVSCGLRSNKLHTHHIEPFREIVQKFNKQNLKGPVNKMDPTDLELLTSKVVEYHLNNSHIAETLCPKCHNLVDPYYKASSYHKKNGQNNQNNQKGF